MTPSRQPVGGSHLTASGNHRLSEAAMPPQNESKQQAKLRGSQAKLRTEVQAFLEPGEQIEAVFLSQTGPSPRGVLSVGLTSNLMRYWVVVATDRNIVICPFGQKGHASRLPREPLEVLEDKGRRWWFPVMIGDTRHWVSTEQFEIVAAANEALRTGRGAPAAPAVAPLQDRSTRIRPDRRRRHGRHRPRRRRQRLAHPSRPHPRATVHPDPRPRCHPRTPHGEFEAPVVRN